MGARAQGEITLPCSERGLSQKASHEVRDGGSLGGRAQGERVHPVLPGWPILGHDGRIGSTNKLLDPHNKAQNRPEQISVFTEGNSRLPCAK